MLNCVYHFNGDMQVVDNDEKDKMIATGAWFDHPSKARDYGEKLKQEINDEKSPLEVKRRKSKVQKENSHG